MGTPSNWGATLPICLFGRIIRNPLDLMTSTHAITAREKVINSAASSHYSVLTVE